VPARVVAVFCLLLWATSVSASTFYVSNAGNDANPGTESSPWKTIAKVNATRFGPGDRILLRRSEVWREQLTVSSSGAPGNPITFGAYGSGANPRLSRMDPYAAWWEHSLITDGSFELFSKGSPNDAWRYHTIGTADSNGGNTSVRSDPTTFVSGTHSVKLVNDGDGSLLTADRAQITTYVANIQPDTNYYFRMSGRVSDRRHALLAVRIRDAANATYLDAQGAWQGSDATVVFDWDADTANTWTEKSIVFRSAPGSTTYQIDFLNENTGTSWVDDAYLVQGSAASARRVWAGTWNSNTMSSAWAGMKDGRRIPSYFGDKLHQSTLGSDVSSLPEGYFTGNEDFFFYRRDAGPPGAIEVNRRAAVYIHGKSDIVLDGIDAYGGGYTASIGVAGASKDIVIANGEISHGNGLGAVAEKTTANVTYRNLDVYDQGNTGLYNNAQSGAVTGCRVHDNCRVPGDWGDCGGIGSFQGGNITIAGNDVAHSGLDDANADFEISVVGAANPFVITGNYVHDCIQGCIQIAAGGDDSVIAENVLNGFGTVRAAAQPSAGSWSGIRIGGGGSGARGVKVYNNVISGGAQVRSSNHAALTSVFENPGLSVKNNIFFQNAGKDIDIRSRTIRGFAFSNNLFFKQNFTDNWSWEGRSASTLSGWQVLCSLGGDSLTADPMFANGSGNYALPDDFRLTPGSPAIDRGLDVGLKRDFAGNPIPRGPAPDIGAYEYQ
jgi:hypothetical protein